MLCTTVAIASNIEEYFQLDAYFPNNFMSLRLQINDNYKLSFPRFIRQYTKHFMYSSKDPSARMLVAKAEETLRKFFHRLLLKNFLCVFYCCLWFFTVSLSFSFFLRLFSHSLSCHIVFFHLSYATKWEE